MTRAEEKNVRRLGGRQWLIAVALGLMVFGLAAPGVLRYGITWDEPTYFRFARLQRTWLGDLFQPSQWDEVFSPELIHRVWLQHPHENGHPPLTEVWQAVVGLPFHAMGMHDTQAFRLSMTLLLGLTTVLLYVLLRRTYGTTASVTGVLVYLGVPNIWAHGHLGATETPQNFFWILLAILTPVALKKGGRWLLFWFIASSLSFATKFTNILIPLWVLGTAGILGFWRCPRFWILGLFGFVLGPLFLLILDPFFWPWQGGWERYVDYLRQVTTRSKWVALNVYYMGRSWGFGPPWHYRIVETAAVLPVTTLALLLPGLVISVRSLLRQLRRQMVEDWPAALGVTAILGALIMGLLPNSPNHDNVRQFIYIFLGVSLLSASGVERILALLRRRFSLWSRRSWLGWALAVPALVSFGISLGSEPWGLAYHSEWLGGARGAWAKGFNVSYWGEAVSPRMIDALRRTPPRDGSRLLAVSAPKLNYFTDAEDFWNAFLDERVERRRIAHDLVPAYLREWLPQWLKTQMGDVLRLTFSHPPDALLVFYNRSTVTEGFWSVLERLEREGDLELLEETRLQGLPLARLYRFVNLETVSVPEDPSGRTWYRPASLVHEGSRAATP
jgi:hypothetical protein